jgi:hypothetical protein
VRASLPALGHRRPDVYGSLDPVREPGAAPGRAGRPAGRGPRGRPGRPPA